MDHGTIIPGDPTNRYPNTIGYKSYQPSLLLPKRHFRWPIQHGMRHQRSSGLGSRFCDPIGLTKKKAVGLKQVQPYVIGTFIHKNCESEGFGVPRYYIYY